MDRRANNLALEDGAWSPTGVNTALCLVMGMFATTAMLYWQTSLEIAKMWGATETREEYTHGWLVLAVTLGLIWRDRALIRVAGVSPPFGGWLLVAFVGLVWLVGFYSSVQAITTLAMPLLVLSAIWAAAGASLARRVALPILLLYFALPVWGLVNPVLQWLTAVVNLSLARIVGIPVAMTEFTIQIPEGDFRIEDGCSGLHFFLVALCIAAVQGHIGGNDLRSRIKLLLLAGSIAIVTNWLRVFVLIMVGHLTNMQHFLVKVDHYYFGWVLFALALTSYFWLAQRVKLRCCMMSATTPRPEVVSAPRQVAGIALTAAALALGPAWSVAHDNSKRSAVEVPTPPVVPGWAGPQPYTGPWRPTFVGADWELSASYRNSEGVEVALYGATYYSQRQGKELVDRGNSIIGSVQSESQRIDWTERVWDGLISPSEVRVAGSNGAEHLIWFTYFVNGKPDLMHRSGRVKYGVRSLFGHPTAGIVAISTDCTPDCESARQALGAIADQLLLPLLADAEQDGLSKPN
jgi:EpsI family protein